MKKIQNVILVLCVMLGGLAHAWCPDDMNNDCRVNFDDFVLLAAGWLSEGENAVPNVLGLTQADAETAITGVFLTVGTVTQAYSGYDEGLICGQDPIAGTLLPPDSEVSLVVSLGMDPDTIPDLTWVSINDPGVPGHEPFSGEMSKYETTNAQFARYLNAAIASGDITVSGSYVVGAEGMHPGTDYVGQIYYDLNGQGYSIYGALNGGAARINYSGGEFTVDSGFENHPVTHVTWYGASAFASYYGWRLPTEWEWQAVADYDGSFEYGCGTIINTTIANYDSSIHPHGTTAVGAFGTYGYGICDLAGNAAEWTSTVDYEGRHIKGGGWFDPADFCLVGYLFNVSPGDTYLHLGFRVCR